jgi:hypothetical protein
MAKVCLAVLTFYRKDITTDDLEINFVSLISCRATLLHSASDSGDHASFLNGHDAKKFDPIDHPTESFITFSELSKIFFMQTSIASLSSHRERHRCQALYSGGG